MESIAERDARMFALLASGLTLSQVAAEIGLSHATMKRRLNKLRSGVGGSTKPAIPHRDKVFLRLIADGAAPEQIAREMNFTLATAIRRARLMADRGLIALPKWAVMREVIAAQTDADLLSLLKAGTPRKDICAMMGRSMSQISKRVMLMRQEGLLDEIGGDKAHPKGDNDGFLEALRKAHSEGAGEKLNVPREAMGRFYPADVRSGCGSSMASCVEN